MNKNWCLLKTEFRKLRIYSFWVALIIALNFCLPERNKSSFFQLNSYVFMMFFIFWAGAWSYQSRSRKKPSGYLSFLVTLPVRRSSIFLAPYISFFILLTICL